MGILHATAGLLRKITPGFLFRPVRRFLIACYTPWRFAFGTGHFRSSVLGKAFDDKGQPVPWFTYPAIAWLDSLDLSELTVLEFGSGQSTLWWSTHTKKVVAFEADEAWFKMVAPKLPENASVHLVPADLTGVEEILDPDERFDIIVVDGLHRIAAAKVGLQHLSERGAILIDNAEQYWGPPGTFPILDAVREAGLRRVDFHGFAPGSVTIHCTSIAGGPDSLLLNGPDVVPLSRLGHPRDR